MRQHVNILDLSMTFDLYVGGILSEFYSQMVRRVEDNIALGKQKTVSLDFEEE